MLTNSQWRAIFAQNKTWESVNQAIVRAKLAQVAWGVPPVWT